MLIIYSTVERWLTATSEEPTVFITRAEVEAMLKREKRKGICLNTSQISETSLSSWDTNEALSCWMHFTIIPWVRWKKRKYVGASSAFLWFYGSLLQWSQPFFVRIFKILQGSRIHLVNLKPKSYPRLGSPGLFVQRKFCLHSGFNVDG